MMKSKKGQFFLNLLVFVVMLLLILVVIESGVRTFIPQMDKQTIVNAAGESVVIPTNDPDLDFVMRKNFVGTSTDYEYVTPWKTNSQGFRDGPFVIPGPDNNYNILLLGDSFTAGSGVLQEERFDTLLEQKHIAGKKVNVYNTGAPAYGQTQQLAILKDLGQMIKPDLVMLMFFTGNDLGENTGVIKRGANPEQSKKRSELHRTTTVAKFKAFFRDTLDLQSYKYFSKRWENLQFNLGIKQTHNINKLLLQMTDKRQQGSLAKESWEVTDDLFLQIKAETEKLGDNVELLVVIAPARWQVRRSEWQGIASTHHLDDNYHPQVPNRRFYKWANQHSIPVLDLTQQLIDTIKKGETLYYNYDGHWNKNGHKVVSELIYEKY